MRHRKSGVKLNRTTSHRQAMFRNMVTSLFKHDRIRTTDVKAKELRRWADQIITLAKRGDLHARRQVMAIVREKDVVHKLFENAAARFGELNGGYTRIIKLGRRPGDAAPVSMIELVSLEQKPKKEKKKTRAAEPKPEKAQAPKTGKIEDAPPVAPADAAAAEVTEPATAPEVETSPAPGEPAADEEKAETAPAQDEADVEEAPAAEPEIDETSAKKDS